MALTIMNPLPQLAINVLIVALVLLVLVPGPNRRLRAMTACALFLVGGVLYFNWRSSPRRTAAPPPPVPELPAPPPPAGPGGVIIADLADLEGLNLDVSVEDAPRVRFKDGCIVVEGRAKPPAVPEPTSQQTEAGEAAGDEGRSVLASIRADIAEQFDEYFDGLVREAAPSSRRLRELRTTLKGLSAEQRRQIAHEVAQLRSVLIQEDGQDARSTQDARTTATQVRVKTDEIVRLARASIPKARSKAEGPGLAGAMVTIGILLAAGSVLKRATVRRPRVV